MEPGKELESTIALAWLERNHPRKAKALLEHFGSAEEAFAHAEEMGKEEATKRAKAETEFITKHNISVYRQEDEGYPFRLQECPDAPVLLYGKGKMDTNLGKFISIVGTRSASERGKDTTRRLVLELAESVPNLTIVSGLAYGIDIAAHKAAMEAGLQTIIIPGHGLDRIYPSIHRNDALRALEKGGILTEFLTGTEPLRQNFIARNRIIAGMADAIIVVESREKGGSMITARMANDYNRELFAVPGRPNDELSKGCNTLIKNLRAQMIENAEDLIRAMNWETQKKGKGLQTEMVDLFEELDETERKLLNALHTNEEGVHVNKLINDTGINYPETASALLMMEMKRIVKSMPGGFYRALK